MRSFGFAARSLIRQPGRSTLGILGIAAVGALLFDMLLLSRGLLVSFRDVLDSVGFDVRVMTTDGMPAGAAPIAQASLAVAQIGGLPEVGAAVAVRVSEGEATGKDHRRTRFALTGVDAGARHPWRIVMGRDLRTTARGSPSDLLVNQLLAAALGWSVGQTVVVRAICDESVSAPPVTMTVVGLADFPFDSEGGRSAAALRTVFVDACGDRRRDEADMILVASKEGHGPDAAVAAIARARPDLRPATNEQMVARMQDTGFSYFRQISTVLSTITMVFGFLLITVLLTVSVNQRLAEIAGIRALGFSRARVARDVLWQSALLVGVGGILAVPLGFVLSLWLDRILKTMPGIPRAMHFFVFEPRALALHGALLVVTALLAAVYPVWLVTSLPIAATLRNEVAS